MSASVASTASSSTPQLCCRCFQPGKSNCSKCKSAFYCGVACQKKDWELGHKVACKEIRRKKELAEEQVKANAAGTASTSEDGSSSSSGEGGALASPQSSASPPPDDGPAYSTAHLVLPSRWLYPPASLSTLMSASAAASQGFGLMPLLPVGLLNPKQCNSCFFNCVLQIIFHTRPFVVLLDSLQHNEKECYVNATPANGSSSSSANKFCILCALTSFRKLVLKHSNDAAGQHDASTGPIVPGTIRAGSIEPKPILPVDLLKNLDKLSSDYRLGEQEDSHDTMKNLLHLVDEAWKKQIMNTPPKSAAPSEEGTDASSAASSSSSSSSSSSIASSTPPTSLANLRLSQRTLETTPISQLCGGYLLNELRCAHCQKFTSRFEFFLDLSLEIIEATDDLHEMLEAFSRPEKLDQKNQYKCSHCSKSTRARKQMSINQQPNVLMIQLKRFRSGFFGKINKLIKFPMELSLRKYMSGEVLREEDEFIRANGKEKLAPGADLSTPYRLYGVVVHLDLMNVSSFGHYICYIRKSGSGTSSADVMKEEWLKYDDESVTKVSVKEVLAQRAYILFYQRSTPWICEEKVQAEVEEVKEATAELNAAAAGSSSPGADVSSNGDSSTPSASPTAAAPVSVQCVGGCGFWGSSATENMCSQCFRKKQEAAGIIQPKPKPSPSSSSSDGALSLSPEDEENFMRWQEARRSLQQIDMIPTLQARVNADPATRAQIQQLRLQVRKWDAQFAPQIAAAQSQYAMMEQQRKQLAAMQIAQLKAERSAQLEQLDVPSTSSAAADLSSSLAGMTLDGTQSKSASAATKQPIKNEVKVKPNELCPCKSGRKYKVCCGKK